MRGLLILGNGDPGSEGKAEDVTTDRSTWQEFVNCAARGQYLRD